MRTDGGIHATPQDVPWIVADFEFEGELYLVVLWPDGMFRVFQADLPWYWKTQPHEDHRV